MTRKFLAAIVAIALMVIVLFPLSSQALAANIAPSSLHVPAIGVRNPGDCYKHIDYFYIFSPLQGTSCFSGNGYIGFRIDDAISFHSGNNYGWFVCYGGTICHAGYKFQFQPFQELFIDTSGNGFGRGVLITQIAITGQF